VDNSNYKIYRSIVRILSMTADCFKLLQLYLYVRR